MAPRMKTEFKFSICSPWLAFTLLLILEWDCSELYEPVRFSSWQRQNPGRALDKSAFSGARLRAREAGGLLAPPGVWNQVHANVAPLLTAFFRWYFYTLSPSDFPS